MKQTSPFVKPHIADQVIADDNAEQRSLGVAIVARQLANSMIFARCFWLAVVLGTGAAIWLHSWMPVILAGALLAALYFKLFVLMSRKVAREGVLPEYQAAYKRLYYTDDIFKKKVDDSLASTQQKHSSRS